MAAAINQAAGGCQCGGCIVHFQSAGCHGFDLPGASVSVYKSGNLITSGTTGSGADVALDVGSAGSGFRVVMSASRFTTYDSGYTVTLDCDSSFLHELTPASGYTCLIDCVIPASNTLHFTDSVLGDWTLTNGNGTKSYDYPGDDACQGCPSATLTIGVTFSYVDGGLSVQWTNSNDPTTPFVTQCPVPVSFGVYITRTLSFACPPSLSGTASFNTGTCVTSDVNNYLAALYRLTNLTVNWTLTE